MKRFMTVFALSLVSTIATAKTPSVFPVQGVLTTNLGTALDGPVNAQFAIYDAQIGGLLLWSESQILAVEKGAFTVYLGAIESLDPGFFNQHHNVWLGITIAGDPEMDRVRLGGVPFAAYAEHCGQAPNHTHDQAALSGVALSGQSCGGGQVMSGINAAGLPMCVVDQVGGGGNNSGISGSGTSNRIAKFKNSDELTSSIITEYSNKIGINDTSPSKTLDVKGDLQVTGDFFWGGKSFSSSSCVVIGGSSCSSACGNHGMSCYKAWAIDKESTSTSCSQSGFKFCCCRN